MTEQQETLPSHCFMCGHPVNSHDPNADGTRPCRSPGHPDGVPCADCRAMLTPEYRDLIQDERGAGWMQAVWGAYTVTFEDARHAFGNSAAAFFTDIHQSALASALITYRQQQTAAEARLQAVIDAGPPSGASSPGEWENGWDAAMEAVRTAVDSKEPAT